MTTPLGSEHRPLRVAIVGSGPSGFYSLAALFKSSVKVEVDMFDRLPTPFGLVRYGVAPDHPKIKNVIKVYEKDALDPRFAFFGNVQIGRDIKIAELHKYYDAVILSCGAETDKPLGIPGEAFKGSYTATEFVGWYNGHPDYQDRHFDLSHPVAVVIGLGNVAMDVSRILLKSVKELAKTDISKHSLEVLSQSKVRTVHIVGRRGPVQSAFTPAEIKEFGEIEDCRAVVNPYDLELNAASQKELEDPHFPVRKKNFDILHEYSMSSDSTKSKKLIFHFLRSPVEIKGEGKVEKIVMEKNILSGEPGHQNATGLKKYSEIDCGIIFRSVGYRGVPIEGIPFDSKKGTFENKSGRICRNGQVLPGLYVTGWIKRGPSGIIGTNKPDSEETVNNLLADLPHLTACPSAHRKSVEELLNHRKVRFINYSDWLKINAQEIARGEASGKPREKFTSVSDMLSCL